MGIPVTQIIQKVIQPPDMSSIEHALQRLLAVGAIDSAQVSGGVTPLGEFYTLFPGNVYAGSMVAVGAALGYAADAALLAVCAAASVFYIPGPFCFGDVKEHQHSVCKGVGTKFMAAEGSYSDAIAVRNTYLAWKYQQAEYSDFHFEGRKRALAQWCYRRGIKEGELKLLDAEFKRVIQLALAAFPFAADGVTERLLERVWPPKLFDVFTENLDLLKILLFSGFHRNLATGLTPKKPGKGITTCNDVHLSNLPPTFPGMAALIPRLLPATLQSFVQHVGVPQGPATADGEKPRGSVWVQFRPMPLEGMHDHGLKCWKDVGGRGINTCAPWFAVDQPHNASITEAMFQGGIEYWASVTKASEKARREQLLAYYEVDGVQRAAMSSVLTSSLTFAPRLLLHTRLKFDKQKLLPIPDEMRQTVNAALLKERMRSGGMETKDSCEEWKPDGINVATGVTMPWKYKPLASLCRFEREEEAEEKNGEITTGNREGAKDGEGLEDSDDSDREDSFFGYGTSDEEDEEEEPTWDDYVQQPYEAVEHRLFFSDERSVVTALPHSRMWPTAVQQYMMFTDFRVTRNKSLVQIGLNNTALWPSDDVIALLLLAFSRDLRLSGVLTVNEGKAHLSKMTAHFSRKRGVELKIGFGLRELLLANSVRKGISQGVGGGDAARVESRPLDMIMQRAAELASHTFTGHNLPPSEHMFPDYEFSPGNHQVFFTVASSPEGHFSEFLPPWKMISAERNSELPYEEECQLL